MRGHPNNTLVTRRHNSSSQRSQLCIQVKIPVLIVLLVRFLLINRQTFVWGKTPRIGPFAPRLWAFCPTRGAERPMCKAFYSAVVRTLASLPHSFDVLFEVSELNDVHDCTFVFPANAKNREIWSPES